MKHWAVIDKTTGEHSFAITDADGHPRDQYSEDAYRFVALKREPGECDNFDGKSLRKCPVKTAKRDRHSRFNSMSRAELMDVIEALIETKIDARLADFGLTK